MTNSTRTSHSTCNHDSTPAARRKCRASRNSNYSSPRFRAQEPNDAPVTAKPVKITQRDGINYRGRVVTVTCKNGIVVQGVLVSWGRQILTVVPDAASQERLGRAWKRESIHNFSIDAVSCDDYYSVTEVI